jgi:hypothetical protein
MKPVKDNKQVFGLLKSVKLYCQHRDKGCLDIIPFDQIEQHEDQCGTCKFCAAFVIKKDMLEHFSSICPKYYLTCHFCDTKGDRDWLQNYHSCYKMHDKKGKNDYFFTKDRIANFSEMKTYYDSSLKCTICQNLLR